MLNVKDILEVTGGELSGGDAEAVFGSVSTDTRSISPGSLFIAIKGPNYDGHDFIAEARGKGASGAVVSRETPADGGFASIKVRDTLDAFGRIAGLHRRRFDIPVIALTGSNGKTTTKEMLSLILSLKYKVLKTEGTENNYIGVPQTLLRMDGSHEIAVIELGTNHPGEIAHLADIVQPNCGIIINAGPSHLEYFGTVDNVRAEKIDLVKRIGEEGSVIVNGNDPKLAGAARRMCEEVVSFGFGADCDFYADNIQESACGMSFMMNGVHIVRLRVLGRHNIYNALAATAAGSLYGVEAPDAAKALEGFTLPKLRMEFVSCSGIDFIFDCYNSNPLSMGSAIETLCNMGPGKRKVLVAGDMLELGDSAPELHRQAGRQAAMAGVDVLAGVGSLSGYILEGAREEGIGGETLLRFGDSVEAAKALKKILKEGDLVLVKGSRGMKMEEIKKCFITCSIR
ncbi:MAG: UDP-N-acetylmuramoyl-tripeptide--D-alanyl-D-alanine ligase [Candidatus Omnitrophica bacterium]|nr:UDP-N-acetylmuramoyl-tripeptide--D-alanyl-D-alanine ligase [Candidatus Omnitrophota bacterium]MDD5736754.1 UDP-N-acetylmuramoyl-tripeptide--D-alanyl-D-alanine ligase [Candidatus Omnitrophota bacterium]